MFSKIRQCLYRWRAERLIKKTLLFLIAEGKGKSGDRATEFNWYTDQFQYSIVASGWYLGGIPDRAEIQIRHDVNWYVVAELSDIINFWANRDMRFDRLHLGDWTEDFIAYGKDAMRQRKREINERFEPFEHVQETEPSDLDEIFQAPHEDEVHTLEK